MTIEPIAVNAPSERDKMVAGNDYHPNDQQLTADRLRARSLCHEFNALPPAELDKAKILLQALLHADASAMVLAPFRCDYGYNIHLGENAYLNYGCVILDGAPVTIGRNVLLAPGVHLYTASHPLEAGKRRSGVESGAPITIKDDVWIGGSTVVCPGVTIGAGTVVGAGSVITRNIPPGVLAVGNPCRVVREL